MDQRTRRRGPQRHSLAVSLYRYLDATPFAEYLDDRMVHTVRTGWHEELNDDEITAMERAVKAVMADAAVRD